MALNVGFPIYPNAPCLDFIGPIQIVHKAATAFLQPAVDACKKAIPCHLAGGHA